MGDKTDDQVLDKRVKGLSPKKILALATRRGRYSGLLAKLDCAPDRLDFGYYFSIGPMQLEESEYCGQKAPLKGYWVYVYPNWYVWAKEDLAAAGMGMLSHQVRLSGQTLRLELAYDRFHRSWAEASLSKASEVIADLERYTGRAYPGENPYRIEEDPDLIKTFKIGLANGRNMKLAPPGQSSTWTLLHEAVHIWNVHTRDGWVREGLANTVSWLLMKENGYAFDPKETIGLYLADWAKVRGTARDMPLPDHYDELPEGKAMAFWLMLYELYGPEFIQQAFVASLDRLNFGPRDLARLIAKKTDKDPQVLFSGWLSPGPYRVRRAADFGPVRFRLPS